MLSNVTLDDKYTKQSGRIYASGIQALVRLPLIQRQRDRAAGLNTAGYISGYRGSPLGGFDLQLWQAQEHLDSHHIVFQPGINEGPGCNRNLGYFSNLSLTVKANMTGCFAFGMAKDRVSIVRVMHLDMPTSPALQPTVELLPHWATIMRVNLPPQHIKVNMH